MSEFLAFAELGFRHITDRGGVDHVLFLLVLAAVYRRSDWLEVLRVVTAFTVGHSVTLLLTVTGALRLPAAIVEFMIPMTILATGLENLLVRGRRSALWGGHYRLLLVGAFGLVHGAGFANYLRSLFVEQIAVPLLGFNVGLEVGQIVVLGAAGLLFLAVDAALRPLARPGSWAPVRLRAVGVSAAVTLVAVRWAVERSPW
jgi:hypothetical protein